jgi:hypothetical protein
MAFWRGDELAISTSEPCPILFHNPRMLLPFTSISEKLPGVEKHAESATGSTFRTPAVNEEVAGDG